MPKRRRKTFLGSFNTGDLSFSHAERGERKTFQPFEKGVHEKF